MTEKPDILENGVDTGETTVDAAISTKTAGDAIVTGENAAAKTVEEAAENKVSENVFTKKTDNKKKNAGVGHILRRIVLAVFLLAIVGTGGMITYMYSSYDPQPYHGQESQGLERLSFTVDNREYYLLSSIYWDFLSNCDLIDAVTNGLNYEGIGIEHEARSSWHNVDSALCATVNLYNNNEMFTLDPLCKICRVELYRVFAEEHSIQVAGIDLGTATKETVREAFGDPDRMSRHKKFVKPVAFVDEWNYYGELDGEMMAFNFNSDTGLLESIEIQAIGEEVTGDESEVEPIREVTSGKPQ